MSLPAPILDDRHFQDIVDEAKKRIPHYCQEWTDHNVSDPGVTFIELFAWMTDMLLYRLNQVPERHYIKFMEMMGISLKGPASAKMPVTFWLSAPQSQVTTIPSGTEVASTQTETETPIVFTTDEPFHIHPPALSAIWSEVATDRVGVKRFAEHNQRLLEKGATSVEVFSHVPQVDDALYLGFPTDLSDHVLSVAVGCETAGGAGVVPTLPPYVWEVSSGKQDAPWELCDVEVDTSLGLNVSGRIELHLPKMSRLRIEGENLYWLRLRVRPIGASERAMGMLPYEVSPRVRSIAVAAVGGRTTATHAQIISHEQVGRSNSEPGQRFFLQRTPILERAHDEHIIVETPEGRQQWVEVSDFADSAENDRHYTIDSLSGEVRFGPAIRERDGHIRLYGAIPPRNATLIMSRYRTGGGLDGNVEAGVINTLKTGIPYIDRVTNRQPALGGLDAEQLAAAKMRVPQLLRSRERAVTADDFEFLARQALPETISRVRCLQPRPSDANASVLPGQVYVLVMPRVPFAKGYLSPDALSMPQSDIQKVIDYLDERRLLTTRLHVRVPAYRWVSVRVQIGATPGVNESVVSTQVMEQLYQFLNPLAGGANGDGWEFGRDLFVADVYQALKGMQNIMFIRSVELYVASPGGERIGQPLEAIDVVSHGTIVSGVHEVEFVQGG